MTSDGFASYPNSSSSFADNINTLSASTPVSWKTGSSGVPLFFIVSLTALNPAISTALPLSAAFTSVSTISPSMAVSPFTEYTREIFIFLPSLNALAEPITFIYPSACFTWVLNGIPFSVWAVAVSVPSDMTPRESHSSPYWSTME